MPKRTLGLIIALLILTIILVIVALKTKNQPSTTTQTTQSAATPTPVAGHTILSMSPNPVDTRPGLPSTVEVMIDTHGDSVSAIQLEIAYDPKVLTNMSIKTGNFFPDAQTLPIGGVNQTTGRITFAVTPANLRDSKSGKGTVATLTFYPQASTSATTTHITLLDKSLITSPGLGAQSILNSVSGTSVNLNTQKEQVISVPPASLAPIQ